MPAATLELDRINTYRGPAQILREVSLRVGDGESICLVGRNGAGKTTTIKCLLNLLRPSSGTVRVFGLDPAREEVAIKSRLAYVPDSVAFYPWMSVRQVLSKRYAPRGLMK